MRRRRIRRCSAGRICEADNFRISWGIGCLLTTKGNASPPKGEPPTTGEHQTKAERRTKGEVAEAHLVRMRDASSCSARIIHSPYFALILTTLVT